MVSVETPFYRAAKQVLAEEIERRGSALALGNAKSFEDYRERVGEIRALRDCLNLLDEVEDRFNGKRGNHDASDENEA